MGEAFDYRKFIMLWNCYLDDIVNGYDIELLDKKAIKEHVIVDLYNKGFDEEEIDELWTVEENNNPTVINPNIWTKFCAFALMRIEKFNSYDDMCDLIEREFNIKLTRTHMPTKLGDDERDEILLKIFRYSTEF